MSWIRTFSPRWLWLLAALVMIVEFLVFDRMTSRYHARVYPRWTDQSYYLTLAYASGTDLQTRGLGPALAGTFRQGSPQGTLQSAAAVIVFWLAGVPSRSAVLSVNMLVFLAWQVSLMAVIGRLSGSRALGWIAFCLPLCLAWPWAADAGSAVDFRLDHPAMCLLGLTATVALLTAGFRSLRWSLVFGFFATVTLLERFLTGVYFVGIFVVLGAWILCGSSRLLRLRNLFLSGLVMLLVAGPIFWLNREAIYTYYWNGQITSADAGVRAGAFSAWQSARYVFGNLAQYQLGAWFLWVSGTITVVLGLTALQSAGRTDAPKQRDWLFIALAFFAVPAAVLDLHRQKSVVVLGIIAPGLILLLLWVWQWAWQRIDGANPDSRAARMAAVALAVVAGLGFFLQRQLASPHTPEFLASSAQVNRVADHIFAASTQAGLTAPRVGVDLQVDYFIGQTLMIICYERHQSLLAFDTRLPTGIVEEKDELIMQRLAECDFVLLTDYFPENGYYPYDRQMRRLYPVLKQWCGQHLRRVETFPIFNRQMSLYQRRELP